MLDGGELPGTASTVVDLRDYERERRWHVLREGALPRDAVQQMPLAGGRAAGAAGAVAAPLLASLAAAATGAWKVESTTGKRSANHAARLGIPVVIACQGERRCPS